MRIQTLKYNITWAYRRAWKSTTKTKKDKPDYPIGIIQELDQLIQLVQNQVRPKRK